MSVIAPALHKSSSNPSPGNRNLILGAGFWLFSYVMLAFRGALLMDWAPVLDAQRVIAVTFGAVLFWRVLRRIDEVGDLRSSLSKVVGWVFMGTAVILIARLGLDQVIGGETQPIARTLSFTLSWSAYFALWILGALAFQPRPAAFQAVQPVARSVAQVRPAIVTPSGDEWTEVIDLLIDEMGDVRPSDRNALAARVLARAGYELAGEDQDTRRHNARVRAAQRLAARLMAQR